MHVCIKVYYVNFCKNTYQHVNIGYFLDVKSKMRLNAQHQRMSLIKAPRENETHFISLKVVFYRNSHF